MYICVLTSMPDPDDVPYDPSHYMNGFRWKHYLVQPTDVEKQIKDLIDEGVDAFINLCDGTADDALSGIALVHALEKYNAAFSGADSKFFDPTRDEMKNAARRVSVPTPNWIFVNRVQDAEKVVKRLKFPMLVKPPHGYASVGIRRNSRVENIEQLREQIELEIKEFGRALIEEFIEGREFTCLIAENPDNPRKPLTFTPVEFIFPSGESFKHYDMKWVEYEKMSVAVVDDPRIDKIPSANRPSAYSKNWAATAMPAAITAWMPMAPFTCLRSTPTAVSSTHRTNLARLISRFSMTPQ
jgi:D-alanine-D-alanine ligase